MDPDQIHQKYRDLDDRIISRWSRYNIYNEHIAPILPFLVIGGSISATVYKYKTYGLAPLGIGFLLMPTVILLNHSTRTVANNCFDLTDELTDYYCKNQQNLTSLNFEPFEVRFKGLTSIPRVYE